MLFLATITLTHISDELHRKRRIFVSNLGGSMLKKSVNIATLKSRSSYYYSRLHVKKVAVDTNAQRRGAMV
ncbi:hypothetical protein AAHA92_22101 [Salvia divinorum]|uniref:Ribosomal protein L33 n=1 Tax=Salvia divinorum TaxID=28513 RepID=A0ABD1GQG8_SALDI